MKKAVIQTGGRQYVVSEGEELTVNLMDLDNKKKISFEPLMVIDGANTKVGAPTVAGASVEAEVVESDVQADKVIAIRYKSKKRVHKVRGHRQRETVLRISKIA